MNCIDFIDIDGQSFFYLKELQELSSNHRFKSYLLSIENSKFYGETNSITFLIPSKQEFELLQKIKSYFDHFEINYSLSDKVQALVQRYEDEIKQFKVLSKNAYLIRNNQYESDNLLKDSFRKFKEAIDLKLVRKLYPLQELSSYHMAFTKNSCNFSVPGAGKTSIVYGAYAYLNSLPKTHDSYVNKLVIIGPIASFKPWEDEYEKCFGQKCTSFRVSGNSQNVTKYEKQTYFYAEETSELTLLHHSGVHNYLEDIQYFLRANKVMLVVDEAHRIKNPKGQWGKSIVEISRDAISRVILTGTPLPNGYEDIYNLFKFIYPFKFKDILMLSYTGLKSLSNIPEIQDERIYSLKDRLSPFFIRIKKDDLGLPAPSYKDVIVKMSSTQRVIYDFLLDKYLDSFDKDANATINNLFNKARLIRLRQAASNPSMLLKPLEDHLDIYGSDALENSIIDDEPIDENFDLDIFNLIKNYANNEVPQKFIDAQKIVESIIQQDEKIIIWTIFIFNARSLKTYLEQKNYKVRLLIGEIPVQEREDTVSKFNNPDDKSFDVVIANPFAVSESISLHLGCRNALYLERDYNCANFLQSMDRTHRYGQKFSPKYYFLISYDSIDEIIDYRLKLKIERMNEIINDEIPLFANIDNDDETIIVKDLIEKSKR